MKTKSISDFKFFKNSYLSAAKVKETNDELVINIKNNMFVMLDFGKRGSVAQLDYINKRMQETHAFRCEMTEYIIADKSETTLLCELTNIKTGVTEYYAGTQMKQPFQNWKVVSQIAGWTKLTHTIVSDIVKTIR